MLFYARALKLAAAFQAASISPRRAVVPWWMRSTPRVWRAQHLYLPRFHMVDQPPALPETQLELAQIALGSRIALLDGFEQCFERVPFSFEGLLVVL